MSTIVGAIMLSGLLVQLTLLLIALHPTHAAGWTLLCALVGSLGGSVDGGGGGGGLVLAAWG